MRCLSFCSLSVAVSRAGMLFSYLVADWRQDPKFWQQNPEHWRRDPKLWQLDPKHQWQDLDAGDIQLWWQNDSECICYMCCFFVVLACGWLLSVCVFQFLIKCRNSMSLPTLPSERLSGRTEHIHIQLTGYIISISISILTQAS